MKLTPLLLVLSSVFLLSSCMSLESRMEIGSDGNSHSVVDIDMSRMITILSAFGTGGEVDSTIKKNLCEDANFRDGLDEGLAGQDDLKNFKCTSLWDYRARIEGDMMLLGKKGILVLSWVTIYDLVKLGGGNDTGMATSSLDEDANSAEALGFTFTQTYSFPGKISYKDLGTLSGSSILSFNALDPKILKRNSLIVITTTDGRKLTKKEINRYKLEMKKQNRRIKD